MELAGCFELIPGGGPGRRIPAEFHERERGLLLEPGQSVEGVIIAQEDDLRIRRALSIARNIRFMKYRVEFHLEA